MEDCFSNQAPLTPAGLKELSGLRDIRPFMDLGRNDRIRIFMGGLEGGKATHAAGIIASDMMRQPPGHAIVVVNHQADQEKVKDTFRLSSNGHRALLPAIFMKTLTMKRWEMANGWVLHFMTSNEFLDLARTMPDGRPLHHVWLATWFNNGRDLLRKACQVVQPAGIITWTTLGVTNDDGLMSELIDRRHFTFDGRVGGVYLFPTWNNHTLSPAQIQNTLAYAQNMGMVDEFYHGMPHGIIEPSREAVNDWNRATAMNNSLPRPGDVPVADLKDRALKAAQSLATALKAAADECYTPLPSAAKALKATFDDWLTMLELSDKPEISLADRKRMLRLIAKAGGIVKE